MATIVQISHFTKKNELRLPNAEDVPATDFGTVIDTNITALQKLIEETEEDILTNAMGIDNFNALQTALADLPNADQKWKDLINGMVVEGRKWEGLGANKSLLAFAVKSVWIAQNTPKLSEAGTFNNVASEAILVSPDKLLSRMFNTFVNKYQGVYLSINMSLYEYLTAKKADFSFDATKFLFYETQNSFGI